MLNSFFSKFKIVFSVRAGTCPLTEYTILFSVQAGTCPLTEYTILLSVQVGTCPLTEYTILFYVQVGTCPLTEYTIVAVNHHIASPSLCQDECRLSNISTVVVVDLNTILKST